MEFNIYPKYVDTIIIGNMSKKNAKLIENAGYSFDEIGECELTMEFYDGIAYDVKGTGLMLRYPTMVAVKNSKHMQESICDYTGIYDGTINQHDIALKYGILDLGEKDADKVIHTTLHDQQLRDETLILMAADIFEKVYNLTDEFMDYQRAARIIRALADQFEQELDWQGGENEERDYIEELEKFEDKALREVEKKINIDSKYD